MDYMVCNGNAQTSNMEPYKYNLRSAFQQISGQRPRRAQAGGKREGWSAGHTTMKLALHQRLRIDLYHDQWLSAVDEQNLRP